MALSRYRAPFLGLALFALLAAIWAGWIRIGWRWPPLQPSLPGVHGPLMVAGFLGTLIALERVVALRRGWMVLSPLFSGLGGLILILGFQGPEGPVLLTLGSLVMVVMFIFILRQHTALYTGAMSLGALTFAIGNILWLSGWSIPRVVLWWEAFLILTIAGERLEIGRLLRFSKRVVQAFMLVTALILAGLVIAAFSHSWGTRVFSLGLLAASAWLLTNDIARHTLRQQALPRYVAICLLSGYLWMGVSGLLGLFYGGQAAGPIYDAFLHTVFIGFVISMIFGHAPIIFPSILGLPIRYSPLFYIHLALLHISLIIRIIGDLASSAPTRQWGGLLNGIAILVFLSLTAISMMERSRITVST